MIQNQILKMMTKSKEPQSNTSFHGWNMSKKQIELPRKFKGIWIERKIWLDERLSLLEKALLAEIDSLDAEGVGCTASNSYFGRFFGRNERHIRRAISSLTEKNLIVARVEKSQANRRYLKLAVGDLTTDKNVLSTTDENVLSKSENTTDIFGPTLRTKMSPPLRTFLSGVSGGIRKENKPNPKGIGENKSKNKAAECRIDKKLGIDSLAQQPLGLGLDAKKKLATFGLEMSEIFRLNEKEAYTFARIGQHLCNRVEAGSLPVTIFDAVVGWAKEAKNSRAHNQKGLFVAKVKQETGFKGQDRLMRRAV